MTRRVLLGTTVFVACVLGIVGVDRSSVAEDWSGVVIRGVLTLLAIAAITPAVVWLVHVLRRVRGAEVAPPIPTTPAARVVGRALKPNELAALRARWRTSDGRDLAVESSAWLAGAASRPSQVGFVDGLVDLRGMPFSDARAASFHASLGATAGSLSAAPRFERTTWRGIDASGVVMRDAVLADAVIDRCRFDSADLFQWRMSGVQVSNCSFARADLRDARLAETSPSGRRSRWFEVVFDRTDFTRSRFEEGEVVRCAFRGAKLRRTRFRRVDFDDVTFAGVLDGTIFDAFVHVPGQPALRDSRRDPPGMRDVDFSNADLRIDMLQGYRAMNVRVPPDVLFVPDFPAAVVKALALAESEGEELRRSVSRDLEYVASIESRGWGLALIPASYARYGIEGLGRGRAALYARAMADSE